ncbi:pilin [Marinomonas sp. THO17]|uniref:pilin n=1 Tax=Marinomonas sp. THO17 TaxID=3149048 RepID=UPI00336C160D
MSMSLVFQRGFTLLELMVVIAIISILASLSAPSFNRQIAKAKLIDAQNVATQHQALVEEFILLNGRFPSSDDFHQIKHILPDDSIVKNISVANQNKVQGDVILTLNDSTEINEGDILTYQRDANRNWACISNINAQILPQQCQQQNEEAE